MRFYNKELPSKETQRETEKEYDLYLWELDFHEEEIEDAIDADKNGVLAEDSEFKKFALCALSMAEIRYEELRDSIYSTDETVGEVEKEQRVIKERYGWLEANQDRVSAIEKRNDAMVEMTEHNRQTIEALEKRLDAAMEMIEVQRTEIANLIVRGK